MKLELPPVTSAFGDSSGAHASIGEQNPGSAKLRERPRTDVKS
ncbi:hypothetical protein Ga0074812_12916 [Parafrankia irregularis]|uniref:Uncharacterized protein n=1 Tax=Parafrankia irregularis TaxID=795642 RepID=A0A0S4QYM8_9ACTN|nr:hypothetical protein Ga0074812_12916 [Parafrankia irregularis]